MTILMRIKRGIVNLDTRLTIPASRRIGTIGLGGAERTDPINLPTVTLGFTVISDKRLRIVNDDIIGIIRTEPYK